MKENVLGTPLSEFPHKKLEMPLLIKNDPLSTAMFYKTALDSITSNQTWHSPTGKNGEMVADGWLEVSTIKRIKELSQDPYDLTWVTNIFEKRIDAMLEDKEYGDIFNSSEIKVLDEIQKAIANDPKTREGNVQFCFYIDKGASECKAPLPSYPHTA